MKKIEGEHVRIPKEYRDNLKKLANYLTNGELKAMFDMLRFTDGKQEKEANTCGTVGCAVGHGPFAGIKKLSHETWHEYSCRCFAPRDEMFTFMFDGNWKYLDNTSTGAANRIMYALEHGVPERDKDEFSSEEYICIVNKQLNP